MLTRDLFAIANLLLYESEYDTFYIFKNIFAV